MLDLNTIREHSKEGKTFSTKIPSMDMEVFGKPYTLNDEITMSGLYEQKNVSFFFGGLLNIIADKYSLSPETVSKLTYVDLQWLTIQLKKNSDNDVIKLNVTCPKCKTKLVVDLNLNEIKIKNAKNFKKIYDVNDEVKMEIGLPNVEEYYRVIGSFKDSKEKSNAELTEESINLFISSIKAFYVGGEIQYVEESDRHSKEFREMVINDYRKQFLMFQNYITEEAPEIEYGNSIECAKCSKSFKIGINDFFYSML